MYKKKKNTPLYITIAAVVLVLIGMAAVTYLKTERNWEKMNTEVAETEEIEQYDVLLYKTNAASIEFEKDWLKSDNEMESVLRIEKNTLVTLMVTPREGYILEQADIVDYDFHEINNFLRETSTDAIRVNFVMPDTDIIINFDFQKVETESAEQGAISTEAMTEKEKDSMEIAQGTPYGLTLHGVTADVIVSYNGEFDDQDFLQQLGDALHIDSARSEYQDVTDVTFSTEAYEGEQEADKVYHYIYFNEDPNRKLLATYYLKENQYLFTEIEDPETEAVGAQTELSSASYGNSISYGSAYNGGSSGSYSSGSAQTITTTTSFDIMQVSTTFLAYVGGEEVFYQKAFDYILSNGLTGAIEGTMSSYEIIPEEQRAEIKIMLNTGASIKGSYSKATDKLEFSGL